MPDQPPVVPLPHTNPHSRPIARLNVKEQPSVRPLTPYQRQGIPVVITGAMDDGPDWTLDWLREHLGAIPFSIRHYGRDRYQQDKRTWKDTGSGVEGKMLTFAEYADLINSGEAFARDLYLAKCAITGTPLANHPYLRQAERPLGLRFPVTPLNLWVGPGGHTTCLHYDPFDGTLMQLHGAKRVLLFPPSQLYNLYPFSIWNQLRYGLKRRPVYSQVYPDRPDLESFPNFRTAMEHQYEVILNQGEILLIPAGWWHEVTALGHGMVCSVNRWWQVPSLRAFRLWSKWRVHLGSVLASPHLAWNVVTAMSSSNTMGEFAKLWQRL